MEEFVTHLLLLGPPQPDLQELADLDLDDRATDVGGSEDMQSDLKVRMKALSN